MDNFIPAFELTLDELGTIDEEEFHMTQEKLDRINELAHLAKERELTADEQEERARCARSISRMARGTIELLENTYIVTPDGMKHKLPKGRTPKA